MKITKQSKKGVITKIAKVKNILGSEVIDVFYETSSGKTLWAEYGKESDPERYAIADSYREGDKIDIYVVDIGFKSYYFDNRLINK